VHAYLGPKIAHNGAKRIRLASVRLGACGIFAANKGVSRSNWVRSVIFLALAAVRRATAAMGSYPTDPVWVCAHDGFWIVAADKGVKGVGIGFVPSFFSDNVHSWRRLIVEDPAWTREQRNRMGV
jgi:hypothetical protein